MADYSVVDISIFGRADDAEAVWDVALAMSAASATAPWENSPEPSEFLATLQQAEENLRAVQVQIHDNWEVFEELASACQGAMLSYVAYVGEPGTEGWSRGVAWRPGMLKEYEFLVHGEEPVLRLSELRAAAEQGLESVNALVDRLGAISTVGVIEMAEGFAEAFKEYGGEGPSL